MAVRIPGDNCFLRDGTEGRRIEERVERSVAGGAEWSGC